jgi:hypothetical protein
MSRTRTPGEPLELYAAEVNAWNTAAARVASLARSPRGDELELERIDTPAARVVWAFNDTEDEAPRFSGLHLTAPRSLAAGGDAVWNGSDYWAAQIPASGTRPAMFGVALEAIAAQSVGPVAVGGRFAARLDIAGTDHRYAGFATGGYGRAESDFAGPLRILYREATGSDVWAIVDLDLAHMRTRSAAQITGASSLGANMWSYSATEIADGFGLLSSGLASLTGVRNTLEIGNTGGGMEANQVDLTADAPAGGSLALRPIASGTRVEIECVAGMIAGETEIDFAVPNGVAVTCP